MTYRLAIHSLGQLTRKHRLANTKVNARQHCVSLSCLWRVIAWHKLNGWFSCCCLPNLRNHAEYKENSELQQFQVIQVTHFRVNEMPITDYVLEYNNFSLGDEDSENIVSERYENRHLRRSLSCLTPHISQTPVNICITLISLETTPV